MAILESIAGPEDVKCLQRDDIDALAEEIRARIIQVTSRNGGHLGPNLGVVELTLALHRVFDVPRDKFVFDVSHQGYVHKLLTGRQGEAFDRIRLSGGYSGFLCREESEYDAYGAGHAGTALSAALGMAAARDLKGEDNNVVALIGDAGLTCGITMEALNNVAVSTNRLIVILNDNRWSISKNVGAIARYLNELITNPLYNRLDQDVKSMLHRIPGGNSIIRFGSRAKKEAKDLIVPSSLFEKYGLRYLGPIDGHDFEELVQYLEFCKGSTEPVLLHVLTTKGRGYAPALKDPERFHGPSPFDVATGKGKSAKPGTPPKYQDIFGKAMVRFARQDERIVGVTAAMGSGTSLNFLRDACPAQFFDVGMAEEHAVLFAAGLATQGLKPVCAIYSTMLQRAYDPIIHDVCIQNLPVVFCMDRAGLSPNDGPTHHGLFDMAYLRCLPNTAVMQPKDEDELVDMLWTAFSMEQPTFIRIPRGAATGATTKDHPESVPVGRADVLREGCEIQIWALGPWLADAHRLADELELAEGVSVGVVNARFIKPIDRALIGKQAESARLFVTMEDHVLNGGFGSTFIETMNELDIRVPIERIGWPDQFVEHGSSPVELRESNGLSPQRIRERVLRRWGSRSISSPSASVLR